MVRIDTPDALPKQAPEPPALHPDRRQPDGSTAASANELQAALARQAGCIGLNLPFTPRLEQQFLHDTAARRVKLVVRRSPVMVLMFVGFLIADWFMVNDRLQAALVLRLGVFVPLFLLTVRLFRRQARSASRDWILAGGGILTVLINLAIIVPSHNPLACAYLATLSVIVVCWDSILRPAFLPALVHSGLMLLGFAGALALLPGHGGPLAVPISVLLLASVVFSLYGSYTLERAERTAYLMWQNQRQLREQLHHAHERLNQQARLDPLTQIPNRRHFDEALPRIWPGATGQVCVMLLDVDYFKPYNDHYGHPAGDRCLHAVAQALAQCVRQPQDLIARIGGEEFAVVLRDTDLTQAQEVAERIRHAVHAQGLTHGFRADQPGIVTISLGLAMGQPDSQAAMQALVEAADRALYQAKASGRDRVSVAPSACVSSVPALAASA